MSPQSVQVVWQPHCHHCPRCVIAPDSSAGSASAYPFGLCPRCPLRVARWPPASARSGTRPSAGQDADLPTLPPPPAGGADGSRPIRPSLTERRTSRPRRRASGPGLDISVAGLGAQHSSLAASLTRPARPRGCTLAGVAVGADLGPAKVRRCMNQTSSPTRPARPRDGAVHRSHCRHQTRTVRALARLLCLGCSKFTAPSVGPLRRPGPIAHWAHR
jgi:hypothetical protein